MLSAEARTCSVTPPAARAPSHTAASMRWTLEPSNGLPSSASSSRGAVVTLASEVHARARGQRRAPCLRAPALLAGRLAALRFGVTRAFGADCFARAEALRGARFCDAGLGFVRLA